MSEMNNQTVLTPIIFHLHQPVGNFPGTFDHAFKRSYEPLVGALSSSGLDFNLHISGALLDWLIEERPAYIELLGRLIDEGRLELLGGGYYEPILAMLHRDDRRRQLERLARRLEEVFGARPTGAWLAERVWEPGLASDLAEAGYDYTLLDDRLFLDLGLSRSEVYGVFATEDGGSSLAVFPIDEAVRYLIPWRPPAEVVAYLSGVRGAREDVPTVVVIMSDAEKMGLWPAKRGTTYTLCYEEGWMRRFLEGLAQEPGLRCVRLSEARRLHPPRRVVYLPTDSYDRMGVWALSTPARETLEDLPRRLADGGLPEKTLEDAKRFIKGTHWRNFLVKYPAAGRLHRLYLYTRQRLEAEGPDPETTDGGPLWDAVDQAVVNDHFWHGLFGGVYYHFLRHHTYRCLGRALAALDADAPARAETLDYEGLLGKSAVLNDPSQLLIVDGEGAVMDWVSKTPPLGLAGGFTRIPEPYHPAKTPGFHPDVRRRGYGRLMILPRGVDGRRFLRGRTEPLHPVLRPFGVEGASVLHLGRVELGPVGLSLEQRVGLSASGGWSWELELINESQSPVSTEALFDLSPSPPSGPADLRLEGLTGEGGVVPLSATARGVAPGLDGWRLVDERCGVFIECRCEPTARLFHAPLRTIEGTEAGIRRSWQGLQTALCLPARLEPGGRASLRLLHRSGRTETAGR